MEDRAGGCSRVVVADGQEGKVHAALGDDEPRGVDDLEGGRVHVEGRRDLLPHHVDVGVAGDVLEGEAEDDEGEVRVGGLVAGLPEVSGAGEDIEELWGLGQYYSRNS